MKLARRVTELAESATLAVASKAANMKSQGIDVIGFGAGEPDFTTPDHIKQACIEALKSGHTGYAKPTSGIAEAKQAFKILYRSGKALPKALDELDATVATDAGRRLVDFLKAPSKRGIGAGPKHLYQGHKAPIGESRSGEG